MIRTSSRHLAHQIIHVHDASIIITSYLGLKCSANRSIQRPLSVIPWHKKNGGLSPPVRSKWILIPFDLMKADWSFHRGPFCDRNSYYCRTYNVEKLMHDRFFLQKTLDFLEASSAASLRAGASIKCTLALTA